jgi:hypothetical protein
MQWLDCAMQVMRQKVGLRSHPRRVMPSMACRLFSDEIMGHLFPNTG